MGRSRRQIQLSERQREILESLERAHTTGQRLSHRVRIVLGCADGGTNQEVAAEVGVHEQRACRWRRRWFEMMPRLASAEEEGVKDKDLRAMIGDALSDSYRSGAPPKFTAEQVAQVIALACEDPSESGLPVSHWTPDEISKELIKRQVVESISPRQVERFLKGGRPPSAQEPILAEFQD